MRWQITPQIIARSFMLCDAAVIFSTVDANRAYLREWLPWLDNISSIHDYEVFIQQSQIDEASGVSLTLGLWDGDNCIGVCGFNSFAPVAKIGYWLAESYQGQGIIQCACQQLINYGFQQLNLKQITLQAAVDNYKSRAVAEKLGFTLQNILPQHEWLYDHYVDHAVYVYA
ncbi:MAG: GNAT family N-acetyltransferase [Burkholderiales bacterium]|nr:GNAT family N-acetyltransferase [Burkholderiales bacterium]